MEIASTGKEATKCLIPRSSGFVGSGNSGIRPLSVRENFVLAFVGQIVFSLSGWGMLICVAKLGNPIMVGQYALGVAVTQPVFMLMGLNLRTVLVMDVKREYKLGHFAALRLTCVVLSLVAIAILANVFGSSRETAWVIFLTGFAVAFDHVSDLTYAVFTRWERLDRQSVSLAARGLLSLVLMAIGVKLTGSVVYGIAGSALASIAITAVYDIPECARLLRHSEPRHAADPGPQFPESTESTVAVAMMLPQWNWQKLGKLVRYSLPLGLILCLVSLNTHVPRYFIEKVLGDRALGLFAAMALIVNAGRTAVLSLSFSTAKRMAENYEHGDCRAFLRMFTKMAGVSLAVGVVPLALALVFGKQFLTLMYRPEYATHLDIFQLVLGAGAIGYLAVCVGCAMTAAKINAVQLVWQGFVTVFMAALCAILVPRDGLRGAAYAALWAVSIQLISGSLILAAAIRRRVNRGTAPVVESVVS